MVYRGIPSVIVYRIPPIHVLSVKIFKKVPYISLVNLIANEEVFPEYLSTRCEAAAVAANVLTWLDDRDACEKVQGKLAALRCRVAVPGACERAASYILQALRPAVRASA